MLNKQESGSPSRTTKTLRYRNLLLGVMGTALTTGILLTSASGYSYWRFGSVGAGLAWLNNSSLHVDEPVKRLNAGSVETTESVQYKVTNLTGHPIRLLGAKGSCTCTRIEKLPNRIGAHQTVTIKATINKGGSELSRQGVIRLFTDENASAEVILAFTVRVDMTGSLGKSSLK